jgi:hypothetical protein
LTTATGESLSADDPLMTAAMSALQLTPRTHGTPETKATKAKDTNATEKDDKGLLICFKIFMLLFLFFFYIYRKFQRR